VSCENGFSSHQKKKENTMKLKEERIKERCGETAAPMQTKRGMGFGEAGFWDAWYKNQALANAGSQTVEWYGDYGEMKALLEKHVSPLLRCKGRYLHVGCGKSLLAEHMVADGYCQEPGSFICSIDFSETVIASMKQREWVSPLPTIHSVDMHLTNRLFPVCAIVSIRLNGESLGSEAATKIIYQVTDVCDLSHVVPEDHTIDVVIDKGCLDSILTRSDSWLVVEAMMKELKRVLWRKPKDHQDECHTRGLYIVVTADDRSDYFTRCGWHIVQAQNLIRQEPPNETVAPKSEYFFFVMKPAVDGPDQNHKK